MATDALDPGPDGDYPNIRGTLTGRSTSSGCRLACARQRDRPGVVHLVDDTLTLADGRRVTDVYHRLPTD